MPSDKGFGPLGTPFGLARYETQYDVWRTGVIEGSTPSGDDDDAIDIACGPGYFCKLPTEKGWRTTAVDTDPEPPAQTFSKR